MAQDEYTLSDDVVGGMQLLAQFQDASWTRAY
jgi:hypothetical protein